MKTEEYFQEIEREVRILYDIAGEARKKGLDPTDKVEIPLARSLAEKVVGLIATLYPQSLLPVAGCYTFCQAIMG